jgi:hypothetical protein
MSGTVVRKGGCCRNCRVLSAVIREMYVYRTVQYSTVQYTEYTVPVPVLTVPGTREKRESNPLPGKWFR